MQIFDDITVALKEAEWLAETEGKPFALLARPNQQVAVCPLIDAEGHVLEVCLPLL